MDISDWIALSSFVVAVGAGLLAYNSAGSAEEAARQNEFALHQRRVDAYQAVKDRFSDWAKKRNDLDDEAIAKLRSACAAIKFLYPNRASEAADLLINTVESINFSLKIMRDLDTKAGDNCQMRQSFFEFIQNHLKRVATMDEKLPDAYRSCISLLELEIDFSMLSISKGASVQRW